jgi:hypothetical protein
MATFGKNRPILAHFDSLGLDCLGRSKLRICAHVGPVRQVVEKLFQDVFGFSIESCFDLN